MPMINASAPGPTSVCAVIVSYRPDAGFPDRVAAIHSQVDAIIVVDNASGDSCHAVFETLKQYEKLILVRNAANFGIAQALNTGVRVAAQSGYAWALLLDQDTSVYPQLLANLNTVYSDYPEKTRLAVIGTHFHDRHRPRSDTVMDPPPVFSWQEVDWVITSGSLISIPVFQAVGPFREDFFIDFVDTEYCLRARRAGFKIIRTTAELMLHAIGASTRHTIAGMQKWTSNHVPDRRYYITRNYTIMLREAGNHRWGSWAVMGGLASLKSIKRIVFYERNKAAKLLAVFHGLVDAIRGKTGKRSTLSIRNPHA